LSRADELAETPAERASLDALRTASGETDGAMERHCVRQFLIAERLGELDGAVVDRELLLCAALLHDAGLYPSVATGDVYVSDRRWLVDGAIRLLHARTRLQRGLRTGPDPIASPAAQQAAAAFEAPWGDSPRLRPHYGNALYAARLDGYPGPRDTWFTFPQNGVGSAPAAGLLVRGPDQSGVAALHAIRRAPELPLACLIPGLVRALRAAGCARLQIVTVAESAFAAELRRVGFVARRDWAPVLAAPLTPTGEAVLGAVHQWEITDLDCDR